LSGDYVCLTSLGRYDIGHNRSLGTGLHVVDVRNPANPVPVGREGGAYAETLVVSGPYAYVADGEAGLQILRTDDPVRPQRVGSLLTRGYAEDVAVSGSYACLALGTNGLEVIDVRDPARPQRVGGWDTRGDAQHIVMSGQHVYIANG
jgi:hypothetical protein